MKRLPTSEELEAGYREFALFTFDLLTEANTDARFFTFAAVNAQISLELFLKYVFTSENRVNEIQKSKNGVPVQDFVEFSQILSHAINERIIEGLEKKDIRLLLDARNAIVHRAQGIEVENELAEIIAGCFLVIHHVSWLRFGTSLLHQSMGCHPISKNSAWVNSVEKFVQNLSGTFSGSPIRCILCENKTVVSGEITTLDSGQDENDIICLCCLNSLHTREAVNLVQCVQCGIRSYFIDILNEQKQQLYVGGCSTCGHREWVRKCAYCEEWSFPSVSDEERFDGKIFCSKSCKGNYSDDRT